MPKLEIEVLVNGEIVNATKDIWMVNLEDPKLRREYLRTLKDIFRNTDRGKDYEITLTIRGTYGGKRKC